MASLAASSAVAIHAAPPLSASARLSSPFLARRVSVSGTRQVLPSLNLRRATAIRAEAVDLAVDAPVLDLPVEAITADPSPAPASFLSSFVDSTKAALSEAAESLADAADSAFESVQDIADSAIESVQDIADSAIESVTDVAESVKESSQGLLEMAKSSVPAATADVSNDAITADTAAEALDAAEEATSAAAPAVADSDLSIPDFGAVQVPTEVPSIPESAPEVFSAPDAGLPEFKAPNFKVPELKAPDFSTPDFKVPDFKVPELNFSKPDFSLPKFEKPDFKLPEFLSPDFNLPEALKSKLSEIELPESIKSKLPELPALPALPKPSLSGLENVPLPKLSLPPSVTEPVKSAVADATAAAETQAALASAFLLQQAAVLYGQVREQVPEEYQSYVARVEANLEKFGSAAAEFSQVAAAKVTEVSGVAVKSAFQAAGYEVDESVIAFTLISIGTGLLIVSYYRAVYGGYSGDLTAEESLKMLKDSRAILLDLRPQALRDEDGIPDLRRGARFKDKSLQFEKYNGQLRGQLRNADSVDVQLFAATVKGLKGVNTGTSVIVMDDGGSNQAKDIARGLAKYGFQRSYILAGGFKAWVEEGLKVKPNEPEALAELLGNEFEAFVEEVKPTPEGVITALAGTGVAVYALWEWERSLQILAVALAAQIIYSRAKTYETSEDLQKDLRIVTAPFRLVATVLGWFFKSGSPASDVPKLATAGADADAAAGDADKSQVLNGSANGRALPSPAVAAVAAVAPETKETKAGEKVEGKKDREAEPKKTSPAAPAAKSAAPAAKSDAPEAKPVAPAAKLDAPEAKPVAPAAKSDAPEAKPVAPAAKSVAPEAKPVAPAAKSVAPAPTSETPAAPVEPKLPASPQKPVSLPAPVEAKRAEVPAPTAKVEPPAAPVEAKLSAAPQESEKAELPAPSAEGGVPKKAGNESGKTEKVDSTSGSASNPSITEQPAETRSL